MSAPERDRIVAVLFLALMGVIGLASIAPTIITLAILGQLLGLVSTEQMIDTASKWAAIGVDHILVDITAPGGPDGRLEALQSFMTDVVPNIG